MRVLGIETSCDETGLALYDSEKGLIGHILNSQIAVHQPFGGVVPELASRDHIKKILPLLERLLAETDVAKEEIDAVAYAAGPGLIGALLVGASVGESLGYALNVPTIGVHHMEAHLLAPMLENERPTFPFLALLVSGGHTLLMQVNGVGDYEILGDTVDDAVGEAFDKTAKALGLSYPGGPIIAELAKRGVPGRFTFPRPMCDRPGLDFSFSGLKTAVINVIKSTELNEQTIADIAHAFQEAAVESLVIKCKRAFQQTYLKQLVIAGGVSANQRLRERLSQVAIQHGAKLFYPRLEFCTDNGAMIAYAGYQRLKMMGAKQNSDLTIKAKARWKMGDT